MRNTIANQTPGAYKLPWYAVIAGVIGLLLGAVSLVFSPLYALGGLGMVVASVIMLKWPEVGILGILVATSSIIFEWKLPIFNIGVGSLHIPDMVFLALMGQIVLRAVVEPDFKWMPSPLDLPMIVFIGIAILSTAIAIFKGIVPLEEARRALRVISYFMVAFPITNLLREDHHLRLLVLGFLALATGVAMAMMIQLALGKSQQVVSGMIVELRTAHVVYDQVARINPPGNSVILTAFITYSVMLLLIDSGVIVILRFFLWGLFGLALMITFNRSYWVAAGLALFLLALLTSRKEKQRMVVWAVAAAYIIGVVLLLNAARPEQPVADFSKAALERLSTLGTADTLQEDSLEWRFVENQYALDQISRTPWIGLGLGTRYRPSDIRIDYAGQDADFRAYIHNAHLWILVKMGVFGYLALVWLSATVLWRGFKHWRSSSDPLLRSTTLGFTLTYLGVLVVSITSPLLMEWSWTPVLGLLMGTNEAVFLLSQRAEKQPPQAMSAGQESG